MFIACSHSISIYQVMKQIQKQKEITSVIDKLKTCKEIEEK